MNKIAYYKEAIYKVAFAKKLPAVPKPIKFNKQDRKRMDMIKQAGTNKTMLNLSYKDKKGDISKRVVEPYKLQGNDFWAYDPAKESIRRFKVKNIKGLRHTKKKFEPRWAIEIN